jgi:hypothetical protein
MERIYVSMKRETTCRYRSPSIFLIVISFIGFILLSFFVRGLHTQAREDLMERLGREKEIAQTNSELNVAHSATTRARFLELQAKRLGLKKAREEEVLVLR